MKKMNKSESKDLGVDIDLSAPFKSLTGSNESKQELLDIRITTEHKYIILGDYNM